jgi:hypothetical protein
MLKSAHFYSYSSKNKQKNFITPLELLGYLGNLNIGLELSKILLTLILTFSPFIILFASPLQKELINLTGTYLDKKSNPISNALVSFERVGVVVADDYTDEDGYFSMQVLLTHSQTIPGNNIMNKLSPNQPNPFGGSTIITVTIDQPGTLSIYNLFGELLSAGDLQAGTSAVSWGGSGFPPGIYLYYVVTPDFRDAGKMVCRQSGTGGLELISHEGFVPDYKSALLEGDSLMFDKPNTTFIKYPFELLGDTSFVQIGNPGPTIFNPIPDATGNNGTTLSWFIPDHVYNDEPTNLYTIGTPNTWVSSDTLYFTILETGTQDVIVSIADITDPNLETLLNFFVTTNPNIQPVAMDDYKEATEDLPTVFNVLENDYDPDGSLVPSSITIIQPPLYGMAEINVLNFDISFSPNPDYFGTDEFEYTVWDDGVPSLADTATVFITVTPVNDQPFATDDSITTAEDETVSIDVLANDGDTDGLLVPSSVIITMMSLHGASWVNPVTGYIDYTPSSDYFGSDSLEYVVWDDGVPSLSDTAVLTITIYPVNDPPYEVMPIAAQSVSEDGQWSYIVRPANVNDVDSPVLTYTLLNVVNAAWSIAGDTITITPENDYFGVISGIIVMAADELNTISLTPFNISITPVNDAPFVVSPFNSNYTNNEDAPLVIEHVRPLKFNDVDSQLLSYIVSNLGANATYAHSGDTTLTITPSENWFGTISGVGVTASDGQYSTSNNSFSITVLPQDDPLYPGALIPNQTTAEDNVLSIIITSYYINPDPESVTVASITGLPAGATWVQVGQTNVVNITPAQNWNGTANNIVVNIQDPQNNSLALDAFNWTATPVNDAPYQVAPIAPQNTNEDTEWSYTVRPTNVDDVDSPTLTYTLENVVNGTWSFTGNIIKINPNQNWYGTISGIVVKASDGQYTTSLTPFNLVVNSVNDAPVANDDVTTTNENTPIEVNVLANDADPNDPGGAVLPSSVVVTAQPLHGTTFVNSANGKITYTPTPGWSGVDNFVYKVGDNGTPQLFDYASVSATVNNVAQVYFKVMDLMQDTLLAGATLHIGNNDYVLSNGDTTISIAPGTLEVDATHPSTIDWTSIWEEYTIIQRPGQLSNVEQRARNDYTSNVTFTAADDTLYVYKLMNDFDMYNVKLVVGSGPQGQNVRFGWDDCQGTPAFMILNYIQPNQMFKDRVQWWLPWIALATKGKLTMVYQEGYIQFPPPVPFLEVVIQPGCPACNGTSFNTSTFEITTCQASYSNNSQSTYAIGIEMIQAIGNLNDIATYDPPILSYQNGQWEINYFGKECLTFLYNTNPGTE